MAVRLLKAVSVLVFVLCVVAEDPFSLQGLPNDIECIPHIKVIDGPYDIETLRRRDTINSNLSPGYLKTIYGMSQSLMAGAGKTIAIIDAYAHPAAESDLGVFSTYYGLPQCTTANGCFQRVDQNGGTNYPSQSNTGWAKEAGLDMQWAHAMAPGANILYIEANSPLSSDLFTAVQYASLHADYVSMSFGANETSSISVLERIFTATPKTSFFASAGDQGANVNYPASSPNVIGVGGTTLFTSSQYALQQEDGWSLSGGGCSKFISATATQRTFTSAVCGTMRGVPDVAFNADPQSGVSIYVTEGCVQGSGCWYTVGGTSLAAPAVAAHAATQGILVNVSMVYNGRMTFRDVTVGNNGYPCRTGFDLVTGMGAWINDLSGITSPTTTSPSTSAPTTQPTTNPAGTTTTPTRTPTTTTKPTTKPTTTPTTTATPTTAGTDATSASTTGDTSNDVTPGDSSSTGHTLYFGSGGRITPGLSLSLVLVITSLFFFF